MTLPSINIRVDYTGDGKADSFLIFEPYRDRPWHQYVAEMVRRHRKPAPAPQPA